MKSKKKTCCIVDFAFQADHRVNIKESEMRDNYRYQAGELKKLWNLKVVLIPIEMCTFGRVPKILERLLEELEIRRQMAPIRTTELWLEY